MTVSSRRGLVTWLDDLDAKVGAGWPSAAQRVVVADPDVRAWWEDQTDGERLATLRAACSDGRVPPDPQTAHAWAEVAAGFRSRGRTAAAWFAAAVVYLGLVLILVDPPVGRVDPAFTGALMVGAGVGVLLGLVQRRERLDRRTAKLRSIASPRP